MLSALTISQAHQKLKKKEISAVELTKACIERIEKVDEKLNAVVYRNFDRALEEAEKIDSIGKFDHPLTGIPYLAKDMFCEKGIPTTGCSNILRKRNYLPPFDSTTTKRLQAKGAISIGKTNTDEFTMGCSTETSCYGVTKCPWDLSRVAGGSSGGSAAAVSADECIFALGTDTGGSIRQPASYCGCSGIKVTYGRTSRYGVMSYASSLDSIGALGKNVEDLAIILKAIAGRDPMDATTSAEPVPDFAKQLGKAIKGLRIGLPKEYFIKGTDPEVAEIIRESAKIFEKMGARIIDINLPHTKYGVATYYIIAPSEASSNMARYDGIRYGHTPDSKKAEDLVDYYRQARSEGFGDEVKRRIMIGTYALSAGYYDAYYLKAQKVRTWVLQDFEEAFKKVDVILTPAAPTPAFKIGAHTGDPVQAYLEDAFTIPASLAGIPGLSLPCGFSKNNLPIGMQLLGPQWAEETILTAGYAFEQATEWHMRKPSL
ncbi:aspartyl/glutamyl-tRNA amidotransferase subunit A [Candidatus Peribacteria bacterium RIFCSPLOWO2_01_FULL_51_18]|nr:MAG: aspartyl/glutamyl-tRNA amidotransferase subunit A [Candidatus Peribacteria bacterium RIFCSPLOWO2_01_FULL_51_18]